MLGNVSHSHDIPNTPWVILFKIARKNKGRKAIPTVAIQRFLCDPSDIGPP